jgi:hypothetical protein
MPKLSPTALKARRARIAEHKTWEAYFERFGSFPCRLSPDVIARMAASLASGVDQCGEERCETQKRIEKYDREQAAFLARPITAATERKYTALIKQRQLYEGACDLAWARYFEYRDAHPKCAPLGSEDLAYAAQWTSCAVRAA